MRHIVIGTVAVLCVSCGPAPAPSSTASTSASSSAPASSGPTAQAALEAYVAALNDGDIAIAGNYYDRADGFHWVERGQIFYESGADAASALQAVGTTGVSKMTLDSIRVSEMTADSALISTHFDFVMSSETGERQFAFDGWMTVGMVRRDDGWKIAGGQTGPGRLE